MKKNLCAAARPQNNGKSGDRSADKLLEELELVANALHRMANGAGTVKGLTIGQLKQNCRFLRDDIREVVAKYVANK